MNYLKVTRTAYPDGRTVTYLYGMEPPKVEDMSTYMKDRLLEAVEEKHNAPKLKLVKLKQA